jgi:cytochrome b pre-mRNA-processing protein 3
MLEVSIFARRLRRLFRPDPVRDAANSLYLALVAQARLPDFYTDGEVADTVDGRFDMIVLHAFIVLHRLKGGGPVADRTGQALFDEMFMDMDRSLREMGVGDMGVGRRVRAMGKAFLGRVAAYEAALKGEAGALEAALGRNLYRNTEASEAARTAMAAYIRNQIGALGEQDLEALLKGRVAFPAQLESKNV